MKSKTERLFRLEKLLLAHPKGLTTSEIAKYLDVNRSTAWRYINELSLFLPVWENEDHRFGLQSDYPANINTVRYETIKTNLQELISKGENEWLEFKIAACWNDHKKAKNNKMVLNVLKTMAGFMNNEFGGVLLIGVADNGKIVGLENDYQAADPNKQNRDGYELFLRNVINDNLGGDCISFYRINFHQIEGKEICQISCRTSSKPIYYKGDFYVRNGNQTRCLTTQEAVDYIKNRWL